MEFSAGHSTTMWIVLAAGIAVVGATVAAKFVWGRSEMNPSLLWIKLIVAGLALLLGIAVFVAYSQGGG